ncbi:MAG: hypothetical protein GX309_01815 [Clostridiales bacterium]|nr:hypothetical protein [Clostridiales bacterium]
MSAAKKQLSDFYNNLYGEDFKFTTIKVDIDLFDYLKYYVLKYSGFFSERKTFHSFLKSGKTLNSNHIKWFRNLIKKHAENSNLRKLDPIIYFEKKLTNELNKNLSIMFKEYPLLSYQIISRPEKSGLEYPKEMITLNDFVSTLDFENNRFLMTLNVFCKTNDLAKIICTLYVECT